MNISKQYHVMTVNSGFTLAAQIWISNPSKTEVIIFTPTRNHTLPTIDCYEHGKKFNLKVSNHLTVLGVYIDCNMNWDQQVTNLRKKTIGIPSQKVAPGSIKMVSSIIIYLKQFVTILFILIK